MTKAEIIALAERVAEMLHQDAHMYSAMAIQGHPRSIYNAYMAEYQNRLSCAKSLRAIAEEMDG